MNSIWSRWSQNWLANAASTLSASAADVAYPIGNVAVPHLDLPWRAPATTAALSCDCGTRRSFRVFGLFGLRRLTAAATVRIMLSDVQPGDDDVLDTGAVLMALQRGFDQWSMALPEALEARYIRFLIEDTGNPDAQLDIGLAWAGAAFETSINPAYGLAHGHDDPSPIQQTQGGQIYIDNRRSYRVVSGRYTDLTPAEATADFYDLALECGKQSCLLLPIPNGPLAPRETICGLLQKTSRLTRDAEDAVGFAFELRERL